MDIPRIHINIKIIIDKPYTYFFVCLFKYRVSCYFVFCDKIIFNGIWCVNIWKITITTYCYTFLTCRFIVGANSGIEGLKYKQVAEKLDVSVNTVKTQLKSAYSKLRAEFNENDLEIIVLLIFLGYM